MFDLFRSRDKSVRIMLGVILGIVAISMVTYLIPNSGMSGMGTGDDSVLAKVGDDKVTSQAVLQAVSMQMRGKKLPPEMMGYFAPQVVQDLINQRVLAYEAKRMGMVVTDDEVAAAIRQQLPPSFIEKDGKVNEDMVASALSQQNLTVAQFIEDERRTLYGERMRQLVESGVVVPKADVEKEFKRRNEKIKIEYVLIKTASLESQVQVSPADLDAFYKKNKQNYQVPEKRNLAMILLDSNNVEQAIAPTDAELQSAYNSSLDRFRTGERVKIRHILIATDAKTTDAQAQTQASDILKQLKAGADFADLAKRYSKDPGSAAKGGDLDWVSRGQMVKPFEDAAFSLKTGETSGLVKTSYGYHILQVQGREDARVKPFAEVKDTLAAEYKKRQAGDRMQQLADRAAADLKKDPSHPEKAAQDVKGEFVPAQNIKPGDPFPQLGPNSELQTGIAGLKQGGVTPPVSIPGQHRVVVALVTAVTPAHGATLDEVRSQVEGEVRRQKLEELVQKRANDLAAKAKADGNNLAQAAKEMGLEVKESADFNRQGAVEGFGSASILAEAFGLKDGALLGPVNSADGKGVLKLISHTPADMSAFAAQQSALRDEIKGKLMRERFALFEDGVRKKLEKDGKVKIQQDALNRLLQGMRG